MPLGAHFTPFLCQCSVLRVFKAKATQTRSKSKQTLESPRTDRTGDLQLRRPRTNQLSYACFTRLHVDSTFLYFYIRHTKTCKIAAPKRYERVLSDVLYFSVFVVKSLVACRVMSGRIRGESIGMTLVGLLVQYILQQICYTFF